MPQRLEHPADKVCAEAGFHPHNAGWQLLESFFECQPLDLPSESNLAVGAKADNVENLLADIDSYGSKWCAVGVYLGLHGCFSCWWVLAFTG